MKARVQRHMVKSDLPFLQQQPLQFAKRPSKLMLSRLIHVSNPKEEIVLRMTEELKVEVQHGVHEAHQQPN